MQLQLNVLFLLLNITSLHNAVLDLIGFVSAMGYEPLYRARKVPVTE